MQEITSRTNQWIKKARALRQKKGRLQQQRAFMEGFRLIGDAAAVGIRDAVCFVSPRGLANEAFPALHEKGQDLGWTFFSVTDSVYDALKDTQAPQGLAAIVPFFTATLDDAKAVQPQQAILYLQDVQDPGNVGTIIRTAAAANTGAIFLSPGSVDVYNDKTIRSAMGAIFKVPLVQDVSEDNLFSFAKGQGRQVYGTAPKGTVSYEKAGYDKPSILCFGNEGNGLTADFLGRCDDIITIPMRNDTESLNLSMSAGIVVYKAWEANGFI